MSTEQMAALRGWEYRTFRMSDDERQARIERERERRVARKACEARKGSFLQEARG